MVKSVVLFAQLAFIALSQAAFGSEVVFSPAPDWVIMRDVPVTDPNRRGETEDGSEYLLVDYQIRQTPDGHEEFRHFASHATNRAGLEHVGDLSVTYDPELEEVTFHHIRILRGDQIIELHEKVVFDSLRRESSLEQGIIDGNLTLHAFLSGLRVGDTLEYAYTIRRRPAVAAGHLVRRLPLHFGVFIYSYNVRALWRSGQTLNWRFSDVAGNDMSDGPEVKFAQKDGWSEFELIRNNVDEVPEYETDLPYHFEAGGAVELSTLSGWGDIVDEILPAYGVQPLAKSVQGQLAQIMAEHKDEAARVTAAFRFVQNEIRYVGIELGAGGWYPRSPTLVSERGFGDCKDKAVLLVSMLAEMGVEADVALVHLEKGLLLDRRLPSPFAFNHAIVRVTDKSGKVYWLDPTDSYQGGVGPAVDVSEFGFALPITDGSISLIPVEELEPALPLHEVSEQFVFADDASSATLTVTDTHRGAKADYRRHRLDTQARSELTNNYYEYYDRAYPGIELVGGVEILDEIDSNEISLKFNFTLDAEALADPEVTKKFELDPYSVRNEMNEIDEDEPRDQPFRTGHPIFAKHTVSIENAPKKIKNAPYAEVDTPFLIYSRSITGSGVETPFVAEWNLRSRKAMAAASEQADYVKALEDVDKTDFRWVALTNAVIKAQFSARSLWGVSIANMALAIGLFLLAAAALLGLSWGYIKKRREIELLLEKA